MATYTYSPNGINNNTGSVLGAGTDTNSLLSFTSLIRSPGSKTFHSPSTTGSWANGTINYKRTADILMNEGLMENLNGNASKDFWAMENSSTPEQHSSQLARKLAVTSISNDGTITYGATNGTSYYLTATTGNIYDRPADAAKDPYGTPPRFFSLVGLSPATHTFTALTTY